MGSRNLHQRIKIIFPNRSRLIIMLIMSLVGVARQYRGFCAVALQALEVPRIAVIGGGASGVFASIAAAEKGSCQVTVLEASSKTLTKVKISGGGRCNVMHNTSRPVEELLVNYPRGKRELNGILAKRFRPEDARNWFEQRGVSLKTESDGRMFPVTDSSQTVIDALLTAADENQVSIRTRCKVTNIEKTERGSFQVSLVDKENGSEEVTSEEFQAVILATGSLPVGYRLAESLGHKIVSPVPSLFTLNTDPAVRPGGLLHGLSGVSVPIGRVSYLPPVLETVETTATTRKRGKRKVLHEQEGPLLVTHYGLSGPAALRISAFGARDLSETKYHGSLRVHWAPTCGRNADDVLEKLWAMTISNPKKAVSTVCPLVTTDPSSNAVVSAIPRRLWAALVEAAGVSEDTVWGNVSKKVVRKIAMQITECDLEMTGKGTFKEEFVTAGGIHLKEIDMGRMESKICPGFFVCGELINVDGVTGGFNFMNAWSTGYLAGKSSAEFVTALGRVKA